MTPTGDVNQGVFPGLPSEGSHLISNAGQGESASLCHITTPCGITMTQQHTLLRRASSLLDTTLNMSSSGKKSPFATISSATRPISVLFKSGESFWAPVIVGNDGSTHPSAICCLNKSPVESEIMSYFRTSRAVSVPLPVPGFPNIIIRSTLPLGWFESAPESASGAAAERELRKRNGRAIWELDDIENARRHMLRCAMSWGEIIVGGTSRGNSFTPLGDTYHHPTD